MSYSEYFLSDDSIYLFLILAFIVVRKQQGPNSNHSTGLFSFDAKLISLMVLDSV